MTNSVVGSTCNSIVRVRALAFAVPLGDAQKQQTGSVVSERLVGLGTVRVPPCGLGAFGRSDLDAGKGVLPAGEVIALL